MSGKDYIIGNDLSDEFLKFAVKVSVAYQAILENEGALDNHDIIVYHRRSIFFNLSYMRELSFNHSDVVLRFNRQGYRQLKTGEDGKYPQAEARVIYGYRQNKSLYMSVDVDFDIAKLITLLNSFGFKTRYCCSGHDDGDMYIVFDSRHIKVKTMFSDDNSGIYIMLDSWVPVMTRKNIDCNTKEGKKILKEITTFLETFNQEYFGEAIICQP